MELTAGCRKVLGFFRIVRRRDQERVSSVSTP